jgi:hypothetical protein
LKVSNTASWRLCVLRWAIGKETANIQLICLGRTGTEALNALGVMR